MQLPLPSHVMAVPQVVPAVLFTIKPLLHVLHTFVGLSVSSTTDIVPPFPSHSIWWQSPFGLLLTSFTPAAAFVVPHAPFTQVRA